MAAPAAAKPTLLVAPLKRVKTDKADAKILTEMIRIQVGQSNRYTLVTPEEMGAIDEELKGNSSGGCEESSCIAEIGGALGARYMITGQFSALESRYILTLKLVDIEQVKANSTTDIRADRVEGIVDQLAAKIAALLGVDNAPRIYEYEEAATQTPKLSSGGITKPVSSVFLEGAPSNAKVQITPPSGEALLHLTIGDKLSNLSPGLYRWRAEAPGYQTSGGSFELRSDEVKAVRVELATLSATNHSWRTGSLQSRGDRS